VKPVGAATKCAWQDESTEPWGPRCGKPATRDDADTSTLALDLADAIDAVLPGLRAALEKP